MDRDSLVTAPQSVKHAGTTGVRRGPSEAGVFLAELARCRRALARDMAARNTSLTPGQVNLAVQEIIDRVVFLRIAAAHGTEVRGQLQRLLDGPDIHGELVKLSRHVGERYHPGLFEPGEPTLALRVGDDALARILRRLCDPESPHESPVLSAAILGQAYEQFLGQVRNAGGIYYTPAPIVDHILDTTLSPLLNDRSPQSAAGHDDTPNRHPLRVLDPSCGSGIFLLGA